MTKARSKSAKIARKRGRPRLPPADKQPNGQPSRRINSIAERDMDALAENPNIKRRIRGEWDEKANNGNGGWVNGIEPIRAKDGRKITVLEQAQDPRRGYVLGLMLLDGTINERQHEAGKRYAEDMARYHGLTGVPFPSARAQDLFAIRSKEGEESQSRADAAMSARRRMVQLRDALLACGDINTGRRVEHTVKSIALLDMPESRSWPGHMVGWLKRGLNKLVIYYSIGE